MAKGTCGNPECDRTVQARGLCTTHYSYWYRANRKRVHTCEQCGRTFESARPNVKMCSFACSSAKAASIRPAAQPKARRTAAEIQAVWDGQRSELRAAYEESRWSDFIAALRLRCSETPTGCWAWQGQRKTPAKSSSPYPVQKWRGKVHQVHRLALEAKHGKPLGTQQAHHSCANTLCVNPDHLQAATHVENIAEMKARRSYELRIAELEAALRSVAPDHDVLDRIEYGRTG